MTNAEGLIDHPTRFLLFTGKGGVGKTSLACATAVALADRGKRVLLVSTDPASNLDEVLETRLGLQPTPVTGVSNLSALNSDPEAAARAGVQPYAWVINQSFAGDGFRDPDAADDTGLRAVITCILTLGET